MTQRQADRAAERFEYAREQANRCAIEESRRAATQSAEGIAELEAGRDARNCAAISIAEDYLMGARSKAEALEELVCLGYHKADANDILRKYAPQIYYQDK